jgi:uncharacterized membrane protein
VGPSGAKRTLAPLSTVDWLLALHVTGAFFLVGGSVMAATLNVLAVRSTVPSESAKLLRLIKTTVIVIGIGVVLTLVLGLWLVHRVGYSYSAFWIWGAIVLWVITNALGGIGGRHQEKARELAERLATEGDVPSAELRALLRDRRGNAMSYGAGLATLLILVLMIWKPGG